MHIARNECPVSSAKCENSFRIYYEFPIFIPIKANICMNYWIYGWKSKESTNLKYSASFPGIYWNKCSISQGNRQSFINIYIYIAVPNGFLMTPSLMFMFVKVMTIAMIGPIIE